MAAPYPERDGAMALGLKTPVSAGAIRQVISRGLRAAVQAERA
jgi:hypothetical protein